MIVCLCKKVSCRDIRSAVCTGQCHSMRDISRKLGVGTQCGKCAQYARTLVVETLQQRASQQTHAA